MTNKSETSTFIVLIVITVVIPLLITLVTAGGENFVKVLIDVLFKDFISIILLTLSGGTLILGVIIAYSNPKLGKTLAYIGIGGVLLSLIFIEVSVVTTTGKNRLKEEYVFQECKTLPPIKNDVTSITDALSCIITGYFPKNYSSVYLIGFWIFGVAIPLIVLSGIFLDLVDASGVMKNKISQRLVGWGLGFMAYRGFVVSNLIYIIDLVSAGMAVIVLNFIFVGGLLAYTNKIFKQWKTIEDAIELGKSQVVAAKTTKVVLEKALELVKTDVPIDTIKNNYLSNFEYVFRQAGLWGNVSRLMSENEKEKFIKQLRYIIKKLS